VRIDDIKDWTPNVYGLPPIKPLFDIYEQNLSLRKLMDRPVIAMGAASGLLQGKIKAMFYRYRSVGGFDYVSDFLIAPAEGKRGSQSEHCIAHLRFVPLAAAAGLAGGKPRRIGRFYRKGGHASQPDQRSRPDTARVAAESKDRRATVRKSQRPDCCAATGCGGPKRNQTRNDRA